MNQFNNPLPHLTISFTAHQQGSTAIVLASATATPTASSAADSPVKVALVIDRSGSMSGSKLDAAKQTVAAFVRSLDPHDQVAVVSYDDSVDLVSGLVAPSDGLARKVETLAAGGSTDLYGGWVMGAKIVGPGGRVVLLSDGQANAGRYSEAAELAAQAAKSYQRYGVTTSTIGVGADYDEALMAGMARAGGGAHYYASEPESIMAAFSQERYSMGSVAVGFVSLRIGKVTEQLGHFWGGETKKRVFRVSRLDGVEASVRFIDPVTGKPQIATLQLPREFGHSDEATLELLLMEAADAESGMHRVLDPRSATEMREELRKAVLALLAHPDADRPDVRAVIDRLQESVARLRDLERKFEARDASAHRKLSLQFGHNMRERGQAYSDREEDRGLMSLIVREANRLPDLRTEETLSADALALASIDEWIAWQALPIGVGADSVHVSMVDPRRGFVVKEIERRTGMRVRTHFSALTTEEIITILQNSR